MNAVALARAEVEAEAMRGAEAEDTAEAALVGRVLKGDQEAFEILYARYLPRVAGFVRRRLRNPADMEEAVQDVFVAVFSSLASFRGDAPFASWVLGIARRTVANRFKRKQHPMVPLEEEEPEAVDLVGPLVQRCATPLEQYECNERLAHLEHVANRQLSREQRTLFELHHLEHQSITDIASVLRKSEDAVKSNLYRARKLLLAR
jgi:RNA polymerase sigma-70 factor, ECF subfamily